VSVFTAIPVALLRPVAGVAERATLGVLDVALGSPFTEQAVCMVLDSPLVGRIVPRLADRLLAAGIADDIARRLLEGPELERIVVAAIESPGAARLGDRLLDSPQAERLVGRVIESRLIDEAVARLLESKDLWLLVDEIARSPSVTQAISHQSLGFAEEMAGEVRERSHKADARVERLARRLFRKQEPDGSDA
jgi:hypothetical protein